MANVCAVRTVLAPIMGHEGDSLLQWYATRKVLPHEHEVMTEQMKQVALSKGLREDQILKVGEPLARTFGMPCCRHCGCLFATDS
jgi:hypothetical protein